MKERGTRPILDRPALIALLNAWANFHAEDHPDTFKAYYETKIKPITEKRTP